MPSALPKNKKNVSRLFSETCFAIQAMFDFKNTFRCFAPMFLENVFFTAECVRLYVSTTYVVATSSTQHVNLKSTSSFAITQCVMNPAVCSNPLFMLNRRLAISKLKVYKICFACFMYLTEKKSFHDDIENVIAEVPRVSCFEKEISTFLQFVPHSLLLHPFQVIPFLKQFHMYDKKLIQNV